MNNLKEKKGKIQKKKSKKNVKTGGVWPFSSSKNNPAPINNYPINDNPIKIDIITILKSIDTFDVNQNLMGTKTPECINEDNICNKNEIPCVTGLEGGHEGAFINFITNDGKCEVDCGKKYKDKESIIREIRFYQCLNDLKKYYKFSDTQKYPILKEFVDKTLSTLPAFDGTFCKKTINDVETYYFKIENLTKGMINPVKLDFKIGFNTAWSFDKGVKGYIKQFPVDSYSTSNLFGFRLEGGMNIEQITSLVSKTQVKYTNQKTDISYTFDYEEYKNDIILFFDTNYNKDGINKVDSNKYYGNLVNNLKNYFNKSSLSNIGIKKNKLSKYSIHPFIIFHYLFQASMCNTNKNKFNGCPEKLLLEIQNYYNDFAKPNFENIIKTKDNISSDLLLSIGLIGSSILLIRDDNCIVKCKPIDFAHSYFIYDKTQESFNDLYKVVEEYKNGIENLKNCLELYIEFESFIHESNTQNQKIDTIINTTNI